jgi:hypothetical protein
VFDWSKIPSPQARQLLFSLSNTMLKRGDAYGRPRQARVSADAFGNAQVFWQASNIFLLLRRRLCKYSPA